jgi:hypothetical protein
MKNRFRTWVGAKSRVKSRFAEKTLKKTGQDPRVLPKTGRFGHIAPFPLKFNRLRGFLYTKTRIFGTFLCQNNVLFLMKKLKRVNWHDKFYNGNSVIGVLWGIPANPPENHCKRTGQIFLHVQYRARLQIPGIRRK